MALQGQEGARKQHDHDVHEMEVQKSIEFLKHNSKVILALMVVILAGFVVLAIYMNYQRTIAERAGLQLNQAETAEQLQEIVDSFPDAAVAPMALFSLGAQHYRDGKYDQAAAAFERFLTDYSDNALLAPGAELNSAFTLMAQGRLEEALEAFDTFTATHPDHFLYEYAAVTRGFCLEQLDRPAEAKIAYEDFLAEHPNDPWSELANDNLEALNRRTAGEG